MNELCVCVCVLCLLATWRAGVLPGGGASLPAQDNDGGYGLDHLRADDGSGGPQVLKTRAGEPGLDEWTQRERERATERGLEPTGGWKVDREGDSQRMQEVMSSRPQRV